MRVRDWHWIKKEVGVAVGLTATPGRENLEILQPLKYSLSVLLDVVQPQSADLVFEVIEGVPHGTGFRFDFIESGGEAVSF